jgi:hypothetical protein
MDEQTKQALQELAATADLFAANCKRWIADAEASEHELYTALGLVKIETNRAWNALTDAVRAVESSNG